MKLWLISQDVNNDYDTYDSAVVVAATAEEARLIHPRGQGKSNIDYWEYERKNYSKTWAFDPGEVKVEYLGLLDDGPDSYQRGDVVCTSFNAG